MTYIYLVHFGIGFFLVSITDTAERFNPFNTTYCCFSHLKMKIWVHLSNKLDIELKILHFFAYLLQSYLGGICTYTIAVVL